MRAGYQSEVGMHGAIRTCKVIVRWVRERDFNFLDVPARQRASALALGFLGFVFEPAETFEPGHPPHWAPSRSMFAPCSHYTVRIEAYHFVCLTTCGETVRFVNNKKTGTDCLFG